jgi:endonuclease-3
MSNKNRGDRIQLLHKVVKKYYKPVATPEGRAVLEHLIYACCLEDARYESADEAFHRLQESYFDWNEVRVTTVTELGEVLHNLPDPSAAAVRVKKNLQSIFETRYSFEIEDMVKMNQGKAIQELEKLGGISKFVLGYTIQNSLGGHAIPVSDSIMKILIATEIVSEAEAAKGQAPGLERTIAKSKGLEFSSCLHQFAVDCLLQPTSKQIKAMLKEAGAVEPPPKKEEPKPAPKAEKPPVTKVVAKKAEKEPEPDPAAKTKSKVAAAPAAPPKPATKSSAPAAPKTAEKPASKTPTKSGTKSVDKALTKNAAKPAAKKAPAKKSPPPAKQATKKTTASKPTKRKPK